jgi:hypothetical protein
MDTCGHRSTSSVIDSRNLLRNLRRSKPDLFRLATFHTWMSNTQCSISPALFAKVGFHYTKIDDRVRCSTCGLEVDSWKTGMDPKQVHIERSPQCPFVLQQTELFTRNGMECSFVSDLRSYRSTCA